MKTKPIVLRFFILASVVLLPVFSGCQDQFEQSNSKLSSNTSMGKGSFTLNLGEVTLGRTILPATALNKDSFQVFELKFFSGSTLVKTEDRYPANPSMILM
jgi:hypothetical protein